MDKKKIIRIILRVLATAAAVIYILFLIDEDVPLIYNSGFEDSSVYLLFLFFVIGYLLLWINEVVSGIILITWHGLQWLLVFCVWTDGELTLLIGVPIAVLGILILVFATLTKRHETKSSSTSI